MQKILVRIGALAAAVVCTVATVTVPSHADYGHKSPRHMKEKPEHKKRTKTYVALGDSYSAGVGTGSPENECFQSNEGYPALLSGATGWKLDYRACSGADVAKVAGQVTQMATHAEIVTVTAGGNDAGFVQILGACGTGDEAACAATIQHYEQTVLRRALPVALKGLYRSVKRTAPRAKLIVVGYPRLFDYRGKDCIRTPDGRFHISQAEQAMLNAYADRLNGVIAKRARASGAQFVDATRAFSGHGVCSSAPYINGLAANEVEMFHPNDAGNVAYARLVARQLGAIARVPRSTA